MATTPKALFCTTGRKLALAVLALPSLLLAQSQVKDATPAPQFDVIVIKLTPPDTKNWKREFNPGVMNFQNQTVFQMVKFAYDLKSDAQLAGLSAWAPTEHFDIQGKEDEALIKRLHDAPQQQYWELNRQLAREMLKERFHLQAHYERKERPIYSLTIAKSGVKVKPFDPSDGKTFRGLLGPNGKIEARGASMQLLADRIAALPEAGDRVVVDNTGMPRRVRLVATLDAGGQSRYLDGCAADALHRARRATWSQARAAERSRRPPRGRQGGKTDEQLKGSKME